MRILWDCRSVCEHMGGIGHAVLGWLIAFLARQPRHWQVVPLFSSVCDVEALFARHPALRKTAEARVVDAGLVDPQFEQLRLPALLEQLRIGLYFNPCFTVPALKTTRFQASVIHDIVFIERPEWVNPRLRRYLEHGTDLALRRADALFTVSEYSLRRIQALAPARNWERSTFLSIVQPAVGPLRPAKAKQPKSDPEGDYFLYLGAIEQKKGIETLLDAYGALRNELGPSRTPSLHLAGGTGGQAYDLPAALARRGLDRAQRATHSLGARTPSPLRGEGRRERSERGVRGLPSEIELADSGRPHPETSQAANPANQPTGVRVQGVDESPLPPHRHALRACPPLPAGARAERAPEWPGACGAVVAHGFVPEDEKLRLLRGALAFVFPSFYEGFGIPPLEAMAVGTPVIAARATSLPEVLGEAALYFEPGEAAGLAAQMKRLCEDRALRKRLSALGKTQARKYEKPNGIDGMVEAFQALERGA